MAGVRKVARELAPHAAWRRIEWVWDFAGGFVIAGLIGLWQRIVSHWDIVTFLIVFCASFGVLIWRDLSSGRISETEKSNNVGGEVAEQPTKGVRDLSAGLEAHLTLAERDRQEAVALQSKISDLEAQVTALRKQLDDDAPLIVPSRYVGAEAGNVHSSLFFVNDGKSVAYDIATMKIIFDTWELSIETAYRLGAGDECARDVLVSGQNNTSDLIWTQGRWHVANVKTGPNDPRADSPHLPMHVRYRDAMDNWYVSVCELWRDPNDPISDNLHFKFIERHRIPKPTQEELAK